MSEIKSNSHPVFRWILRISLFTAMLIFRMEIGFCDPMYYARYQIQSENGMIIRSILEIIPAADEFRIDEFQRIKVTGMASGTGEIDAESEAIHNAISRILVSSGLKSINSRRFLFNADSGDVAILNYEGVVRLPIIVRNRNTSLKNDLYGIDAEIDFAPIAFPTRWSSLYIDHLLKKTTHQIQMFLSSAFLRANFKSLLL
jgi:hypothetical protein